MVFTEQLAKIKSKGSYWKPRKLSLIGRVCVANIFILSRLWYRAEIFSIPPHIFRELESYIAELVWNRKKHEVNKKLLCASLKSGGLRFTKLTKQILSQRVVWLSKLYNMEQNSFAKVIAEENLGNFDADYTGLVCTFSRYKQTMIFNTNSYMQAKNSNLNMKSEMKNSKKNELVFYNARILDSNGNPYKPIRELTRVGIFRVRNLIFKKGQKNYNRNVFVKIKQNKRCVKTIQNHQPVPDDYRLKIRAGGHWIPFSKNSGWKCV